jgi:hypothetical protein
MNLERRITTLEKSSPKHNPLADLSDEELKAEMFKVCQRLHAAGVPIDKKTLVKVPKCRQFSDEAVWVKDRTHRLGVFLQFKGIVFKHSLPNHDRIISILNQGWGDDPIHADDKEWLVSQLSGIDLGEEGPWLKEYLDYSGSKEA